VEFFKAFYDLLKEDMLLMIRESQKEGRIHGPLNATFMCLIPKKQFPSSFEDYRPITYCNVIYKLITKIISRRLRPMLSEIIGEEQFGFLHNRQIHDASSHCLGSAPLSQEKKSQGCHPEIGPLQSL
jgi:hypothetical protein